MDYLEPGRILHLWCEFDGRPAKYKFLVLTDADEDCLFFVFNSQVTDLVRSRPALMQAQIEVRANEYRFLQYDSWLACHEPYLMARTEVLEQIEADPDATLRGTSTTRCGTEYWRSSKRPRPWRRSTRP